MRDTNGDDVADEYIRITPTWQRRALAAWAQLGAGRQTLMSKGVQGPHAAGPIAPKPFRELWGVESPAGAPHLPPAETFTPETYRNTYHHPSDDWGREGGSCVIPWART